MTFFLDCEAKFTAKSSLYVHQKKHQITSKRSSKSNTKETSLSSARTSLFKGTKT